MEVKEPSFYKEKLKTERAKKKAQYLCTHPVHVTRCSLCNLVLFSEKTKPNEEEKTTVIS